MTYSEKLRDPRWQKRRLEILQRDNWCCRVCFDGETMLSVHHRYYERGLEPWDYPAHALVTLCQPCHEFEGNNFERAAAQAIEQLKVSGALAKDVWQLGAAFATTDDNPLDEYDWSVLTWAIVSLLASRNAGSGAWNEVCKCASNEWCRVAEETTKFEQACPLAI